MQNKQQKRKPLKDFAAFAFCTVLSTLVNANENAHCPHCIPENTFLLDKDGIIRKRRAMARVQRAVSQLSPPTAFTLDTRNRTAKHYKGSNASKHKELVIDSGASISTCCDVSLFESIEDYHPGKSVQVANGQHVQIECTGTLRLTVQD